ncbi:MAG TPA: anthranilate synthase component I [Gammaproteobacteria bacterium]|jgi:anthranilate synthase component 1|nr:anthranilate synthase component I [Gammaproteobacteria bacterium]
MIAQPHTYKRIPISREALADLDTPLSVYLKLAQGPYSYLLESAEGGEKWGRYSIIGLPARTIISVSGSHIEVKTDGEVVEALDSEDPLTFIEDFLDRFKVEGCDAMPRFFGGLVGYFGYDTVRYVERRLAHSTPPDKLNTPDILLMVSEDVVVFDNLEGRMQLISLIDPDDPSARAQGEQRLLKFANQLAQPVQGLESGGSNQRVKESDFVSEFGEDAFKDAVERIRDYTKAGDIMQVVLAQRMHIPFQAPSINLYRALRRLNPSPYMYFMDLGDFEVIGSSPEILARLEDGVITNRPLAGTRRRGHTPAEDLALEEELKNDPKEIAEHLMLIDLGRNDVGRVAKAGSVKVTEQFSIERYSHVMHLSSNVEGELEAGKSAMDLLRAALPVGTLSGAPKVRAMEIIDELEPVKRGIYGGAIGYLAWNGNMDTAIAIRTAVVKDGFLYIEAGGGIVHDSIPRLEWKESLNKGRAIFRAAAMAENKMVDPAIPVQAETGEAR